MCGFKEEEIKVALTDIIYECGLPEEELEKAGLIPGFIGPFGLPSNIKYVIDDDLRMAEELVCGANKKD